MILMRPATCRRMTAFSLLFLSPCAVAWSPVPKKERTVEQKVLRSEAKKWGRRRKNSTGKAR
jgi:hypothetical protein